MVPKRSVAALLLAASTLTLSEVSPHVQVDDAGRHVALALNANGVGSTEGELAVAFQLLSTYSTMWGEGIIPMACASAAYCAKLHFHNHRPNLARWGWQPLALYPVVRRWGNSNFRAVLRLTRPAFDMIDAKLEESGIVRDNECRNKSPA
jgi:hypothetical protein